MILGNLGSQFSLYWHAAYNDRKYICTLEAAEKIIDRIGRKSEDSESIDSQPFEKKTIEKVRDIDFEPKINIQKDKTVVRLIFFTKWGGFIEGKYIVKNSFPYQIIEEETDRLVEYDCGYVY